MYFCSICSRFSAERMHGPNVSGQRNRIYKFGKTKIDQRLMKYAMVSVDLLKQQDSTFQDISYVLLEKHGISLYQHICSFSLFFVSQSPPSLNYCYIRHKTAPSQQGVESTMGLTSSARTILPGRSFRCAQLNQHTQRSVNG